MPSPHCCLKAGSNLIRLLMLSFECCQGVENTASMGTHSRASAIQDFFPLITVQFPLLQHMPGLSQVVTVHVWAASDPIFSVPSHQGAEDSKNVLPQTFLQARLPPLSHPLLVLDNCCPQPCWWPCDKLSTSHRYFWHMRAVEAGCSATRLVLHVLNGGERLQFQPPHPSRTWEWMACKVTPPQSGDLCSRFRAVGSGCLGLLALSGLFPILCGISL